MRYQYVDQFIQAKLGMWWKSRASIWKLSGSLIIINLYLTDITTSKSGQQIPYGERITLRPEPHERQPFSKGGFIFVVTEISL